MTFKVFIEHFKDDITGQKAPDENDQMKLPTS